MVGRPVNVTDKVAGSDAHVSTGSSSSSAAVVLYDRRVVAPLNRERSLHWTVQGGRPHPVIARH